MSDHIPHEFMMIGLHKMAAERGDGLIPELLTLYATRQRMQNDASNIVAFPEDLASPACAHAGSADIGNDNVIAFRPRLAQKSRPR
jgi:hypothetical protein